VARKIRKQRKIIMETKRGLNENTTSEMVKLKPVT